MNQDRFLGGPHPHAPPKQENTLGISWFDSAWINILNASNVMDYFFERSNPFYDRTCNNETLRMQRLGPEHLSNMVGLEYALIHVQEPILFCIQKRHRHSPNQVTPIADYYIIAGIVYQAPDLASVIGTRMLQMVHHMQSAFDEASSYSRYHPSKGYWWEFKDSEKAEKVKTKEEPGSAFQRRRVDVLLGELAKKFPPKLPSPPQLEKQTTEEAIATTVKVEAKEVKSEKTEAAAVSTVTSTTVTQAMTTTTITTPLPPPPPPVPIPSSQVTPPTPRGSMKPPPEKKPRLG